MNVDVISIFISLQRVQNKYNLYTMKTVLFTLSILLIFTVSCTQKESTQFKPTDLTAWNFVLENDSIPTTEVYSAQDGIYQITGVPLGYMYTKEKFTNYTLEVEWRWTGEAGNSGIFVLIEEPGNPFPTGIECQLKAGKAGDFVLLAGSQMNEYQLPEGVTERPAFPVIEKQQPSNEKPAGEWNKAKITVDNGKVTVYINDELQNTGTSEVKEGHIGLQSEGQPIEFRNLAITKI